MRHTTTLLRTSVALAVATALLAGCSDSDADDDKAADAPSSDPTTTAAADPDGVQALPPNDAGADFATLAAGRYRIALGDALAFDVDVPSESYAHDDGLFVATGPVVLKTEIAGDDFGVAADPCTRHGIVPAGPGADDLVRALRALAPFHVTEPRPVTLGGARGTYLEATLPASYDTGSCQGGEVQLPGTPDSAVNGLAPYIGRWWVLDVEGQRVMVQQACWECTAADMDAVTSIPESLVFTPAG
ncbi:MAG TPA: hypothetical protein VM575_08175 [Nocardioides sp.]|jgi:hypothetical protein|nr:hypothetical protein [Nocardioides sp.]